MFKNQVIIFLIFIIGKCLCQDEILLEIAQGTLKGTQRTDRKNGIFYSFQSIPFAKPPIGALRFKEPQPAGNWDNTLDATQDLPECYQEDYLGFPRGVEDCLYLNVYTPQSESHLLFTPQEPATTYDTYKAVMVFIYGGGFYENSGREDLYSPVFLMTEDIVLVTFNYRLGIFGSFSLNDTSLGYPGNLGMKDQALAIKWVKDNINRFGGDANSITIFGESAGAVSVHLQMLSPLSAGNFHKAIIQSGTAISPWVVGVPNNGILLASALDISTDDPEEMINQLIALSGDAIYAAYQTLDTFVSFPIIEPESENAFLTKNPLTIIQEGNYHQVPIIVGYNDAEGIAFQSVYTGPSSLIPADLGLEKDSNKANELLQSILDFYFDGVEPTLPANLASLVNILTDTWFAYPSRRLTLEHLKTAENPIYFYRFSADTLLNVYKRRIPIIANFPGAIHADDLGYLFKTLYHDDILPNIIPGSTEDRALDRIMALWTNFAKYGNPTPDDFTEFKWEPVTSDTFNYVDFGSLTTDPGVNPDEERMNFWHNEPADSYTTYKTVVVFIHGGGFSENSACEILRSPVLLMTEDIVLVTINYRLEIFGNFYKAIIQNGTAINPWAEGVPNSEDILATALSISTYASQEMINQLLALEVSDIQTTYLTLSEPIPAESWEGTLNATNDLPACVQGGDNGAPGGQEDCLYLNVYTPQQPADSYTTYKKVMVFIHGGSFSANSAGEDLHSPIFLMTEDIVLVTINYRVGIFGSFSLNDTSLGYPGNLGLKDKSLGLKWVKDNINRFGGDENDITIFGESAGGVSVHLQVLSPLSAGTFHKAIIQSGTAISPWAEGVPNSGVILATALGISTDDPQEMINQLLALDVSDIQTIYLTLDDSLNYPIVEPEGKNSFLTKNPLTIIREGSYNDVPLMVGHTNAEGIRFHFVYLYPDPYLLIPDDLEIEKDSDEAKALLQKIYDFYFDGAEPTLHNNELSLINLFTDIWFGYPSIRLALEHVKTAKNPIYFYRFSADTQLNVYKRRDPTVADYLGAAHGDELGYLFSTFFHDYLIPDITPDSVEDKAIDRITALWTNFAKYGNPTPDDFNEFKWEPITNDTFNYIDFGTDATIPGVNPDEDRVNFWHSVYSSSNLLTYIFIIGKCLCQNEFLLQIPQGTLIGVQKLNRKHGIFYSFQKIPYAKPPVNELRFKHPADNYTTYKTVMVLIHPSAFAVNSASESLHSPVFLMTEDIVLVTINYRLGIFGSFSLNDTSLGYPGNLGLKDQTLGLKWVKDNINRFGGDTNDITIFGASSGGISVHLHVLSPLSTGTFHKAIIQSGDAFSPWAWGVPNNGVILATALGISTADPQKMIKKLLALSVSDIQKKYTTLDESLSYPIIEPEGQTSFITKNPLTIIREGTYNHVPLIVGHNDAEGMGFHFVPLDEDPFLLNPTELRLERDSEEAVALLQKIYDFYFNGTKPTFQNNELSLINVYTDIYFAYPSIRLALEHVKTAKSPIYLYRFSADTKLNVYKRNDQTIAHYPGAAHGDELGYLFRTFIHDRIVRKITPGSVEDKAIDRITKLWTNFAKYGNPTPADFNEFQWKPVTSDTLNYIDFGTVSTVPGVNSDVDRMNFWHNAYFDSNLFTSEPLLISTSILKRLLFSIILFSSIYYIFRFY
ncbi:carboxylesterase [Holotrichia oblita]|uniref:Carboxylesterase n=1 Tax=Holotrichia oblita TaxID=644536 RepID=A0ACB9TPX8_HOLOL|nr:carboxylesterase [Holotrichia oblita]